MAESTKTTQVVVDASYALAYLLPDEKNKVIDKTFIAHENGEIECISTVLLPFEVGNSLRVAVLRKHIGDVDAKQLMNQFMKLQIQIFPIIAEEVFALALQGKLTMYDAGYLWLALEKELSILTIDKQLTKVAKTRTTAVDMTPTS